MSSRSPSISSSSSSSSSSTSASSTSRTPVASYPQPSGSGSERSSKVRIKTYTKIPRKPPMSMRFVNYVVGKPLRANHIRKTSDSDGADDDTEFSMWSVLRSTPKPKTELYWVNRRDGPSRERRLPATQGRPVFPQGPLPPFVDRYGNIPYSFPDHDGPGGLGGMPPLNPYVGNDFGGAQPFSMQPPPPTHGQMPPCPEGPILGCPGPGIGGPI